MKLSMLISTWATKRGPEYIERQEAALKTWHAFAHRIVLINKLDDIKNLQHVENIEPLEENPTLAQLIKVAALGRGLSDHDPIGIINADVALSGSLEPMERYIKARQIGRAFAASSQRIENGITYEWAYDLFIATKKVWKEFRDVPTYLKLGEPMWDIWLNSKFRIHVGGHRYMDLTPLRIVNHPQHEWGREINIGANTVPISGWAPADVKLTP